MASPGTMAASIDPKTIEALLGPKQAPFLKLMSGLTTSSGRVLSNAKSYFDHLCANSPSAICFKLFDVIDSQAHHDIRVKASSLVRDLLLPTSTSFLWPRLNPRDKLRVQNLLFISIIEEKTRPVLELLRGCMIELGRSFLSSTDVVIFTFRCMVSTKSLLKESGFLIYSHLAEHIERSLLPPIVTVRSILLCALSGMGKEDVWDVRNAALLAAISLIRHLPPSDRDLVQDLLPYMMFVLVEASISNKQELAKVAVNRLILLIASEPRFNCQFWTDVLHAMIDIAEFDKLEEELRRDVVNLVVALAWTRRQEPVVIGELVPFLARFVAILLQMLSDIEDDEAWYTADPGDEDSDTGEENNFNCAKEFSNDISAALGEHLLVPAVIEVLSVYMADSDWKKRHAALIFLKEVAKRCSEAMNENLEQFVNMMGGELFDDVHPRVQCAALGAMCVLFIGLKPDLAARYHDMIFPALLQATNVFNCPHVQLEALVAAWIFICSCSNDVLKIHLKNILDTLFLMILTGNRLVQSQVLLILESLADSLKDVLEIYYIYVMLWLKSFLRDAICKANRMLCCKLMLCISAVGTVLGKGYFRNDAKEVMEELMSLKGAPFEAYDPATGYMLKAWMSLLRCLGRDFLPYMDLVMPPLLQSAQSDLQLTISSTNSDNEVKSTEDDDENLGTKFRLLNEKTSACHMLLYYIDELNEDFYPWIDQVASLLLPFLKSKFHKEVRKAASLAISKLLFSAKLAVEKGIPDGPENPYLEIKQFCAKIILSLMEALHKERDAELRGEMLKSLVNCIQLPEVSERKPSDTHSEDNVGLDCGEDALEREKRSKSCEL